MGFGTKVGGRDLATGNDQVFDLADIPELGRCPERLGTGRKVAVAIKEFKLAFVPLADGCRLTILGQLQAQVMARDEEIFATQGV